MNDLEALWNKIGGRPSGPAVELDFNFFNILWSVCGVI